MSGVQGRINIERINDNRKVIFAGEVFVSPGPTNREFIPKQMLLISLLHPQNSPVSIDLTLNGSEIRRRGSKGFSVCRAFYGIV